MAKYGTMPNIIEPAYFKPLRHVHEGRGNPVGCPTNLVPRFLDRESKTLQFDTSQNETYSFPKRRDRFGTSGYVIPGRGQHQEDLGFPP